MSKLKSNFEFTHSLKRKVVRDQKIVTELLPLTITGIYYCDTDFPKIDVDNRYDIDVEEVIYNGANIKEVLEFTGTLEDIENEIIKYAPNYFTEDESDKAGAYEQHKEESLFEQQ